MPKTMGPVFSYKDGEYRRQRVHECPKSWTRNCLLSVLVYWANISSSVSYKPLRPRQGDSSLNSSWSKAWQASLSTDASAGLDFFGGPFAIAVVAITIVVIPIIKIIHITVVIIISIDIIAVLYNMVVNSIVSFCFCCFRLLLKPKKRDKSSSKSARLFVGIPLFEAD